MTARRQHARKYNELLAGIDGFCTPLEAAYAKHIYHIYALRAPKRDELISSLAAKGISCGIHYPVPIHLQDAYRSLGLKKGSFPAAENSAKEFLSLPMYPELTDEQIEYVCQEIRRAL